jgi:UDP-glucose 4-epimerase
VQRTILIWGGTGFIGRHLAEHFHGRGRPVSVAGRRCLPSSSIPFILAGDDLAQPGGAAEQRLVEAIRSADVIFNLAGTSGAVDSNHDPIASLDGNCRIQARFLECCAKAGNKPHVVFASSRLVYGRPASLPVEENTPLSPRSHYAAHKICVEHYHRIASLHDQITFCICRISNPYGYYPASPGRWQAFINTMILRGLQGLPLRIFGEGTQLRDYIHIADLCRALELCGLRTEARNQVINVGHGQSVSIREAAETIHALTDAPVEHVDWAGEFDVVESGDYSVNLSKIKSLLQFEPEYSFRTGVEEVIGAHRAAAPSPAAV